MSLIFASGFLIPQSLKGLEYFRGLRQQYPGALFPRVDVTGTVEARANQLAEQIDAAFPSGRIDIIAHSMGGLDARFLLAHNLRGLTARVATLSTISTPHRGSPVADLLAGPTPLGPQRLVYDIVKSSIARLGWPTGALGSLTTGSAMTFNQQCLDSRQVTYFAYAGCGPRSLALRPSGRLIEHAGATADERQNDGLVSVASAQWPDNRLAEPPWPADHLAEVGYDLDHLASKPSFDSLAAIARIVQRAVAADVPERQLVQQAP